MAPVIRYDITWIEWIVMRQYMLSNKSIKVFNLELKRKFSYYEKQMLSNKKKLL